MEQEQIEEIKRHFGVIAEALRTDVRLDAEGHSVIRREIQEFRGEVRLSFAQLDRRISRLESGRTE